MCSSFLQLSLPSGMMCGVTSAKRWRWVPVVSGLVWLVLDRLVGSTKEDGMDSTAPARIKRNAIIKLDWSNALRSKEEDYGDGQAVEDQVGAAPV